MCDEVYPKSFALGRDVEYGTVSTHEKIFGYFNSKHTAVD